MADPASAPQPAAGPAPAALGISISITPAVDQPKPEAKVDAPVDRKDEHQILLAAPKSEARRLSIAKTVAPEKPPSPAVMCGLKVTSSIGIPRLSPVVEIRSAHCVAA